MYISPESNFVNYCGIGYSTSDHIIMFNRHIKDIATGNTLGLFSVALDNRKLGQLCDDITNKDETVLLSNSEGEIYYSNQQIENTSDLLSNKKLKEQDNGYCTLSINGQTSIVVFSQSFDHMILMKIIPYSILEKSIAQSLNINAIILIFRLFLSSCFLLYSLFRFPCQSKVLQNP